MLIKTLNTTDNSPHKISFVLSEMAKVMQQFSNDLENSAGFFNAVGEKNETFCKVEESINNPVSSFLNLHNFTQERIFNIVLTTFKKAFYENKDYFHFVNIACQDFKQITFFVSTKDDSTREKFENFEFDFFKSDVSQYIDLCICFLEQDMESELLGTSKL